jgi:hypothetical protein
MTIVDFDRGNAEIAASFALRLVSFSSKLICVGFSFRFFCSKQTQLDFVVLEFWRAGTRLS